VKLGMIITQIDPETVFNAVRLASYSLEQGDEVRIFLSGRGVEIDQIEDAKFDVRTQAQKALDAGGQFLACGACLNAGTTLSISSTMLTSSPRVASASATSRPISPAPTMAAFLHPSVTALCIP
jgi:sulfur relay (sulfurtransferase) complex TusBCD TusD component (DsrE family)